MNLRDIEYFVAVAETGHFTKAAERCFVSQPTLSGQIKKLEEELGSSLFERDTRNIRLTSFGDEILPLAQKVLFAIGELNQKAAEHKNPYHGAVSIGAFPTLGPWLLPRIGPTLKNRYPKSDFFLVEEKTSVLRSNILSGILDAAFLAKGDGGADLMEIPVFNEEFLLALAPDHPLAGESTLSADKLKGLELLLLEDGHCLRNQVLDLCRVFGAQEKGHYRASSLETLRQMVLMNNAMTLMPRLAIPDDRPDGLSYIPISEGPFFREIVLCFRKTHPRLPFFVALAETIHSLVGNLLPVFKPTSLR